MRAVMTETRRAVPFTRADLAAMPDDGRRYELVDGCLLVSPFTLAERDALPPDGYRQELLDGCLLVTPAPNTAHQRAVTRLWRLLDAGCPPDLEAFVAPLDVVLGEATALQPDVLVARRRDVGYANVSAAPLLAVEVLSPSTRRVDLTMKRARFERAGTLAYWVFDPDGVRLRAWDLRDGAYVEVADVRGGEAYEAGVPFAVTVVPASLVD